MNGFKLTEDLVTIIALDSFTRDLYDMLSEDEQYTSHLDFIRDLYAVSQNLLATKLKNMPQYESLIQKFNDTYPKGYTEDPGELSKTQKP